MRVWWEGAGALEAAAREGARQALKEAASAGAAGAAGAAGGLDEAREAADATLAAVRQLEAALSARINGLAATIGTRPAEPAEPGALPLGPTLALSSRDTLSTGQAASLQARPKSMATGGTLFRHGYKVSIF